MASFVQEAVRFVPVSKAAETSEIPALHSIPCRIDHTGPAPVSSYFHSQCEPDPTGQFHQATFRGRPLDGNELQLPDGYQLYAVKEKARNNGETKIMEIHGATNRFWLWNLDREPSSKDPIRRAIDFLKISAALAADD